jgi:hypothetical protein
MFIRIKKRELAKRSSGWQDYSLRIVVVESYRKEGLPRQRIVKYLGSTRLSSLRNPGGRKAFIRQMSERLEHSDLPYREIPRLKISLIDTIYHQGRRRGALP